MTAVWSRVRAGLRERARSWIGLAVIIGVFGGIVIAAAAGARRTDSAYPNFLRSQRAYQQFMFTFSLYPGTAGISAEQLRALPEVDVVVEGLIFDGVLPDGDFLTMRGSADPRLDRSLNAVNVFEGRLPKTADEVLIPAVLAEKRGYEVGDVLRLGMAGDPSSNQRTEISLRISGIGIAPGEFPPENDIGLTGWAHVAPAFVKRHGEMGGPFAYVFLKRADADLEAFQGGLSRLSGGQPIIGYQQSSLTKNVLRAFHLQAVSLWLLALMLGVTVTALVGQTISRVTWLEAQDHAALSAIGMTRSQLFGIAILRVAIVSVGAAIVAGSLAFVLSPLAPIGRARQAVIEPGFAFDATAIGLGAIGVVVLAVALTVLPAWRTAGALSARDDSTISRSFIAEAALRGGAPATTGIGLRFALERGRGRTAVPTRATMLGATLAVAAIAMTLSFGGSLTHLLNTPRLYGATYDLLARSLGEPIPRDRAAETISKVRSVPGVFAVTEGGIGFPLRVNGELADSIALDPGDQRIFPPLLEGRYPRSDDEIALGASTFRKVAARIGGTVEVGALGAPSHTLTVVGIAVIPTVGHSGNLGEGAMVTATAVRTLFPEGDPSRAPDLGDLVISIRSDADLESVRSGIRAATGGALDEIVEPLKPGDLVNFGGQRNLPFVLAAILAVMAAVTIGHALVSSINRRRRDIAILKATGFTQRQARRTIAWQASALMTVGLAFGLPIGIAVGRALWTTYARTLGIIPEPRPPFSLLLLVAPAALVLSNLVALLPARRAARIEPAVVLRTE